MKKSIPLLFYTAVALAGASCKKSPAPPPAAAVATADDAPVYPQGLVLIGQAETAGTERDRAMAALHAEEARKDRDQAAMDRAQAEVQEKQEIYNKLRDDLGRYKGTPYEQEEITTFFRRHQLRANAAELQRQLDQARQAGQATDVLTSRVQAAEAAYHMANEAWLKTSSGSWIEKVKPKK